MFCLLFPTSSLVTPKLIRNANEACKITPEQSNYFALARHSLADQISRWPNQTTSHDQQVESFEGSSDSHLQTYYEERLSNSSIRNQMRRFFAVLDERSTKDDTIIIHFFHREIGVGREIDRFWISWRVRVAEARAMMTDLRFTPQIFVDVYSKNGVFPVEAAVNDYVKAEEEGSEETDA